MTRTDAIASASVWRVRRSASLRAATATCRAGPTPSRVELRPEEVKDFAELYRHNCSGCHGPEGRGGAALALANPVYLAITDEETLRRVTSTGVPGTSMPAFARQAGGTLTDEQIDVLVREIRGRWSRPDALGGVTPPAYRSRRGRRTGSRRTDLSDVLRLVPRSGRQRRTERELHRRRIVPRTGERPGPSHHRDCRAAGSRPARLARLRRRPIAVEPGRVRRRGLARVAAAPVSGPALSGGESRRTSKVQKVSGHGETRCRRRIGNHISRRARCLAAFCS